MRDFRSWIVGFGCVLCISFLSGAGCIPPGGGDAAVLEGTWTVTPEDPGEFEGVEYEAVFDANGNLVELSAVGPDGGTAKLPLDNATTELDGNAVTITIPTPLGTRMFEGTLSEDQNTMVGSITQEIDLGGLEISLPKGDLTFERIVPDDPCEDVTCEDGETCVDGECVADDPCEDVTCEDGETCVDGVCVADDLCDGVTCEDGETCVDGECVGEAIPPTASVSRGGALYDKFWVVTGGDEPTDDHPLWASRPDPDSNTRTGSDTWRCKECHGWDYKGVAGAYATGSHRTGIVGIFETGIAAQDAFDLIKDDGATTDGGHDFGSAGLTDDDIWDLVKFVLEGQIDTDDIIDASGAFTGDTANGQTLYEGGIGGNLACAICHGTDGTTIDLGDEPTIGAHANANAWEFQHKVRFGQPGTVMPAAADVDASASDVGDVGAYSQTLPEAP